MNAFSTAKGNTYCVSEALDQTQEGHGGGSLLGFPGLDVMVSDGVFKTNPEELGKECCEVQL